MATKKTKEVINEPADEEDEKNLVEAARKVLMASIGAFALGKDEIEDFINRLVERGEIAEKDGRKLMHDVLDKRKNRMEKAEDEITKRVEAVLERMSVPSKSDIDALSEKISALSQKLDDLKKG